MAGNRLKIRLFCPKSGGTPTPTPGMADQVTTDGVTFFFSELRPVQLKSDGSYLVELPVTITATDPPSQLYNGTYADNVATYTGRTIHGLQINPGNASNVGGNPANNTIGLDRHGYDDIDAIGATQNGRGTPGQRYGTNIQSNMALNFDPGHTSSPLVVTTECTLVKSVSMLAPPYQFNLPELVKMVPLHCVEDLAPSADYFPPSISSTSKESIFAESMLDYSVLPQLPLPSGSVMPDIAATADKIKRMHNQQYTDNLSIRHLCAVDNQEYYGRDIATYMSEAALILCLDIPDEDKAPIAVNMVKQGIDFAGRLGEGGIFPDLGAGNTYRKFVVCLAARMLHNAAGVEVLEALCPGSAMLFAEDRQFFETTWTEYNTVQDVSVTQPERVRRNYEEWQRGTWEWSDQPTTTQGLYFKGENFNVVYRDSVGCTIAGMIFAANVIDGMRDLWGNERTFEYFDRLWSMQQGDFAGTSVNGMSDLAKDMFTEYWSETPVAVPNIVSAEIRGDRLWVLFDRMLNYYSVPAETDFVVNVNGSPVDVIFEADPSFDGPGVWPTAPNMSPKVYDRTVAMTLETAVAEGDTVTVSYTGGTNKITTVAGSIAANFTNQSVTNLTGTIPINGTSISVLDNNSSAYSQIVQPFPLGTFQRLGIVMRVKIDALNFGSYFGQPANTSFRVDDGASGAAVRMQFTGRCLFNSTSGQLSVGTHTIAIELNLAAASIAAGGCRMFVDGVEVGSLGSSTFSSGSTFSFTDLFSSAGLALLKTVSGTINGGFEFFWLDARTAGEGSFDFGNPTVLAKFTTTLNAIGYDGSEPTGASPLYYYRGIASQANAPEGMMNSGRFFGVPLKKIAGTYT